MPAEIAETAALADQPAPLQAGLADVHSESPKVSEAVLAPPGDAQAPAASLFEAVVSGEFDLDDTNGPVATPRRILQPQAQTPKLHKILAQSGMGSRLEMERLILEGRISVNNEPAHIGQRIQFGDQIKVNGKPVRFRIDPPPARESHLATIAGFRQPPMVPLLVIIYRPRHPTPEYARTFGHR